MQRRELLQGALASAAISLAAPLRADESKTRPIKCGQIGTKHAHASGQMATMRNYPKHFEVVGAVEPDAAQRQRVADHESYRGLKWMTEEQLLNAPGLELVAVETAIKDLLPTARRCVDAGKHIHLDKPAGESMSALQKLHASADRQDLMIQMGYMFRYNPGFLFLFRAAREGWLGDVFEVHGVISKTVNAESRQRLAVYPGGSLFELGCHLLDPLFHLMGPSDRVTGYVRNTRPQQDVLNDNMLAVFEYPRATATIRSALVEVDGERRRQFVVCGDRGTIVIRPLEAPKMELTLAEPHGGYEKGTRLVTLPTSPGRYDGAFMDIYRVIRGEKNNDFSHEHDLAVQHALLEACHLPMR